MKEEQFDLLIQKMGKCRKCMSLFKKNGQDCSLINIFGAVDFAKNIPSIWTDWYHRLESEIFIVGQDWGPYIEMERLYNDFLLERSIINWKKIIESERSQTKKKLTKFLVESSDGRISNLDSIFITNAIMCARKGEAYRGDNICLAKSVNNCRDYLKEQIEIVKPKVVVTLGYYPLLALSKSYDFSIENTLQQCIKKQPVIKVGDFYIICLYHPVAQVSNLEQLEQYKKIWTVLSK